MVGSDATAASAFGYGMAADTGSLQQVLNVLRDAVGALSARLGLVQRAQPGYRGGRGYPGPAEVARELRGARQRILVAQAGANRRIRQLNHYVAEAYRLSERASAAGQCRSAAPPPPAQPPIGLTPRGRAGPRGWPGGYWPGQLA